MRWAIVAALVMLMAHAAWGQHNHAAGHDEYLGWSSGVTSNCCSNQDCGALTDDEVRETAAGTEVNISGAWCPVRREHFITRGKSPDWNKPHACIRKPLLPTLGQANPCDRLLCFSGRGGV